MIHKFRFQKLIAKNVNSKRSIFFTSQARIFLTQFRIWLARRCVTFSDGPVGAVVAT